MNKPYKVSEMSPREIKIHNIARMWINTYEDKGAVAATKYYYGHVENHTDRDLIIERMKELNGHA